MDLLDFFDREKHAHCIICKRLKEKESFGVIKGNIGICSVCHEHLPIVSVGTAFERRGDKIRFSSSVFYYAPPIKELIIEYKFKRCTAYADIFVEYMNTYLDTLIGENETFDLVIPVPLSEKRFKERGYNQAELLSEKIAERFGFEHNTSALIRTKSTSRQSKLPVWRRAKNTENAFLADECQVDKKSILLIDDVFTTGSTAGACAKVLFDAGASSISVFTIARKRQAGKSREYYDLFTS